MSNLPRAIYDGTASCANVRPVAPGHQGRTGRRRIFRRVPVGTAPHERHEDLRRMAPHYQHGHVRQVRAGRRCRTEETEMTHSRIRRTGDVEPLDTGNAGLNAALDRLQSTWNNGYFDTDGCRLPVEARYAVVAVLMLADRWIYEQAGREPERKPYMTHLLDAAAADRIGIPSPSAGSPSWLAIDHVTTKTRHVPAIERVMRRRLYADRVLAQDNRGPGGMTAPRRRARSAVTCPHCRKGELAL